MMVLKKKEIIAGALVLLIGAAGYLNWSYKDVIRVTDGESYSEETAKRLGEAQYVNSVKTDVEESDAENTDSTSGESVQTDSETDEEAVETASKADYFITARAEKESSRSRSLEILKQTAENESFDPETRRKAQEQILQSAKNVEAENTAESIARAKGYDEVSIYSDGENVDIIVRKDGFSDKDAMILKDIASEQLKISAKNIKVVEIK